MPDGCSQTDSIVTNGRCKLSTIKDDILWIAWERHRRTVEMCCYFDIQLVTLVSNKTRLARHPVFIVKTIREIFRRKPRVLIVQNPSIVLTLLACILKKILKYRLVVDSHNAGVVPDDPTLQKLKFLYRYLHRNADVTIVTNERLADIVSGHEGSPFVMPDKLPDMAPPFSPRKTSSGKFNVVCICTFGGDEPYEQLVQAAGRCGDDFAFHITGNYRKISPTLYQEGCKPANVTFTGFLPELHYAELLHSAHLIIDLTNREDCLVCGAYEAVAVEVPVLLSDTRALRRYFHKGTVFSDNSAEDLARKIAYAMENIDSLKRDVVCLKFELQRAWPVVANDFIRLLDGSKRSATTA